MNWETAWAFIKQNTNTTIRFYIRDKYGLSKYVTITTGEQGQVTNWADDDDDAETDELVWDTGTWSSEEPEVIKKKLDRRLKGKMLYVEIQQEANDINWNILNLEVHGKLTHSRFT
jgi:hypothetical protein